MIFLDLFYGKYFNIFSELTQIVSDVTRDPTLPKTHEHPCPKCQNEKAVFFQAQSRRAEVSFKNLFQKCLGRNAFVLRLYSMYASLDRLKTR